MTEQQIIGGHFRIISALGSGGFGLTFLAEDLRLPNRPRCVLKKLHAEFPDEKSFQIANRLFHQEAETLYHLGGHPKITSLIAHFEENGEFFLVQELVEGATLAQNFAAKGNYNEKEAVELITQILETLTFVHSRNVIHRDIKPTNLIRRASDGSIFLIDFGAVKQVGVNPHNQNPTFQSTITIGSTGYMPPEQTAGKPRFASDLYSAGLVTIEALTGLNPLKLPQNPTTGEFVWQHKTRINADFGNFLSKLVRYDFRQRYNSANEAFASLQMLASIAGYNRKPLIPQTPIQPVFYQPAPLPQAQFSQITIAPTVQVMPNQRQTLFQPVPLKAAPALFAENNAKKSDSSNDFKLAAGIIGGILALFFVSGFMIYAAANYKTEKQVSSAVAVKKESAKPGPVFQEALDQAEEAETKEEKAKTPADWNAVGLQYERALGLAASVPTTSSDYPDAQKKANEYHIKSDAAFQKSKVAVAENPNYPTNSANLNHFQTVSSSNYPTTTTTTTTPSRYPTPTPKPVVTMPAKQSYSMYLAYNIVSYSGLEKKVITTNDAIFTSSVEKQSNNMRDSGVVRINLQGGSYSSASLAFKAPHGQRLSSGNYSNAQEFGSQSPTMYAVSFDKMWCSQGNHSFSINSIIYDDLYSNLTYLDASFTIACDNKKVMGRIRYDSR